MIKFFTTLLFICLSIFCNAQTFSWTGYQHIGNETTINVPINVSGLQPTINNFFGAAHICLNITHSYEADLIVKLKSPAGTTVTLLQDIGGSGNNFTGTCLGMDGVPFNIGQPPYTGLYFPVGQISDFNNGQNPNGSWLLTVIDVASPDTGSIHSASIEFTNNPPVQPGTPGSGAPVGTYLCGSCSCPGGVTGCDLLPDMTASAREILLNHEEQPGVLYISNATPNIGSGPLDIYGIDSCFCGGTHVPCNTVCTDGLQLQHVVKQRVYQKVPGRDTLTYRDRFAGKMTFHPAHNHIHVDNWASYTLRTATSNPDARTWPIVATGTKQSFCLINLGNCASNPGECVDNSGNTLLTVPNSNLGWHTGCGLNQGIYPGNYDVYSQSLNDPMPLVNVCNGTYYIVSITDPDNVFEESDKTNNWVAVPITLTMQSVTPAISPNGSTTFCQGGSVTLTSSPANGYLWSNGATTQSIVVSAAGTFTVTTNCGTSALTSAPITTTVIPANSVAAISIAITTGTNPTCAGVYTIFTASPVNGGTIPVYQWKLNGVNVGTNSSTFASDALTNGQVVSCTLTSQIPCLANAPAVSNAITIIIQTPAPPTAAISLSTGTNPGCAGALTGFTAAGTGLGELFYQWKLNGVNVGTNANTYSSYNFTNGQAISCEISSYAGCPGTAVLGTSLAINDIRQDTGACYPTYWGNGRQQYLMRPAELNALGYYGGRISALEFHTAGSIGDPSTLNGYTIKIGQTTATALTNVFLTPQLTTVFGPVNYTPVLNSWNRHSFSSSFEWDGTSNLLIDVCFSNQVIGNAAYQNYQTTTAFISNTYYENDGVGGAGACTAVSGNIASVRPNMIFTIAKKIKVISDTIIIDAFPPTHIYTFTGSGNWSEAANWVNQIIPPPVLSSCNEIVIDPPLGQQCILNVPQTISAGAKLTVRPNKKFIVSADLSQLQ